MRKLSIVLLLIAFLLGSFGYAIAEDKGSGPGPAPNAGDCNPDGPGWPDGEQPGPYSSGSGDSGQGWGEPAPGSGDGISEGPER